MKSFLLPLCSLLALSLTFTSCKKDKKEDPAPVAKTKTELITGKNWKVTAATIDPAIDLFGTGTPTTNLYAQLEDCNKDDLIRFDTPNAYKEDEGGTKCDATDPQTITGTWVFSADETKVTTNTASGGSTTFNITELTETTLKGTVVENFGGPVNYTLTITHTKQ